jgi:lysophosphatidylglycerol acyltransferase 1
MAAPENHHHQTSSPPHHHLVDDPVQMAKQMSRSTNSQNDDEESLFSPTMDFRKLMAMTGAFYWFIMTTIIVPTACVSTCILILPIMIFSLKLFNKLEHVLCTLVNDHWVGVGQYMGLTVEEYGDDISAVAEKRALFMANHLGLIDHFCLMTAFHNKPPITGKYLWVIYNIWKMTPLGALWTAHGNFFINGGASKRAGALQEFRDHLKNNFWKHDFGWIVMYPEGSRLFIIKNAEKKFAEKNNFEPFKHCAHPRIGAAHAVLSVCGPSDKSLKKSRTGNGAPVEYIIDCTLGYPNGKIVVLSDAILGEWPGSNSNVSIHYNIHKVQSEWSNEEIFKEWLYKQYEKKDKLLDDFYRTGQFPGKPRPVHFSIFRNALVQIFWITVFYANYSIWIRPLGLYLFSFFY